MRQNTAAQQSQVLMAVRRGDDVTNAVGNAEAAHGQRLFHGTGAIIDSGQDVAMQVEHVILLSADRFGNSHYTPMQNAHGLPAQSVFRRQRDSSMRLE